MHENAQGTLIETLLQTTRGHGENSAASCVRWGSLRSQHDHQSEQEVGNEQPINKSADHENEHE